MTQAQIKKLAEKWLKASPPTGWGRRTKSLLAERSGVSVPEISRLLGDKGKPSARTLVAVENFLTSF
jgi:transcriptional regulator with XRE-family HTH domain